MDNAELMNRINAAVKGITEVGDLGEAILQPDKLDRFVREAVDESVVLAEARFQLMDAQQMDIDRIGFAGRIMRSGHTAANGGGNVRILSESEFVEPVVAINKLIARELQSIVSLRDHALRRNIERGGFEDTLLEIFGEAAGRDLEEYAFLADTAIPFGTDDVLSQSNGWVREAGNKLYGMEWDSAAVAGTDFDEGDASFPENLFEAMLGALPKRFMTDIGEWRFYVPWAVRNQYQSNLMARGTPLGDRAISEAMGLVYKGIPVVYVPALERVAAGDQSTEVALERDRIEGRIVMLSHPNNMAWGIFHEVTVEPEREAKARRTDFVLTVEADAGYEDENGVVVALLDKAPPA